MRRLLPTCADTVDLAAAYAYPDGGSGGPPAQPWLRANMVSSADGAATAKGRSAGLSNEADRLVFRVLRALADVVLVGAATVRKEGYGPALAHPELADLRRGLRTEVPAIAVVSNRLDLPADAPLFTSAAVRTLVITAESSPDGRRAELTEVAEVVLAGEERVDLGLAVDVLVERGHTRLLCEGGPRVLAQVAAAGRLDEVCLTLSPVLTSGDAPRILNGEPLEPACNLRLAHVLEDEGSLFLRYVRG